MIFNKKNKKKCENCGSNVSNNHSFCSLCGNPLNNSKEEKENYGLLGKNDFSNLEAENSFAPQGFGITDRMINSIFNSMMKSLDKQFKNQFNEMEKDQNDTEIKSFPNGISIKISGPFPVQQKPKVQQRRIIKQTIDEEQIKRINSLPKGKAKTTVKRLGNKIIYELSIPGITSPKDVFVSKLESGYEIKAIGPKKVYVNSVPINLPLDRYTITKDKLSVEFKTHRE